MIVKPHLTLDGYKLGHRTMFPEGMQKVQINATPRNIKHFKIAKSVSFDGSVFFGLQPFVVDRLVNDWNTGFFARSKTVVVQEYLRRVKNYLGVLPDVKHIEALHDLGYLPIRIMALPEGSLVPVKVPFLTVENTHEDFGWLPNALETFLSVEIWKPIVNATTAYHFRKMLKAHAAATGVDPAFVDIQAHDFSMRGQPGLEASALSGAAHLAVGNIGTDTLPAIDFLEQYYFADSDEELVGVSVNATEHSVACSNIAMIESAIKAGSLDYPVDTLDWLEDKTNIRLAAEYYYQKRLISEVCDTGIVSTVSDTYDYWSVISLIAPALRKEIDARKFDALGNSKVVFRPDSGDPFHVICGYNVVKVEPTDVESDGVSILDPDSLNLYEDDVVLFKGKYYKTEYSYGGEYEPDNVILAEEITEAEALGSVVTLANLFGTTTNAAGFKSLYNRIGLIYGDSITPDLADRVLTRLRQLGYASDCVVFGVGSYQYQGDCTRDTLGIAVKATYAEINGVEYSLSKDPKTDSGKKSAMGKLDVVYVADVLTLVDDSNRHLYNGVPSAYQLVFHNSYVYSETTLAEIRKRLNK